ncbi:ATP-binding protein [Chondromyces crocatus]|uniref:Histidine kinase/HSP90-like ATPase domain-containing protein n=1 Tax=Chondromyces crocatus TaxID=52 RepID=A0A0K1EAS3_CHOCO|nr:ATP-binding protein [Chondromyces crocatus]AKT37777.1 uncharacterized protein CMC5_019190 [Chondromyces crocatus]
MIRLRVPGSLTYRHLALRVVSAACRMAISQRSGVMSPGRDDAGGKAIEADPFDALAQGLGEDGEDDAPESGPTRLAAVEDLGTFDPDEPLSDEEFEAQTLSAVGEAFNNIAIHAYRVGIPGHVDIEIESDEGGIMICLMDTGSSFEPGQVMAPDMTALPESGMGLFIMNSFMDEVDYRPGNPNVLRLVKHRDPRGSPAGEGGESPRGGTMNARGAAPTAGAA